MKAKTQTNIKANKELISNLFNQYSDLPLDKVVQGYMKTFKSVFNDERPSMITKYFVSQVSLIQSLSDTEYSNVFSYCFTKGTINYANYDNYK